MTPRLGFLWIDAPTWVSHSWILPRAIHNPHLWLRMVANIHNVSIQGLRQEDCFLASSGFQMKPCFKRGKNPPLFILKADLWLRHLSDSLWRVLMYILLSLPPWPMCLALTTFYTICAHCLLGLHWVFLSQTSKTGPSLSSLSSQGGSAFKITEFPLWGPPSTASPFGQLSLARLKHQLWHKIFSHPFIYSW